MFIFGEKNQHPDNAARAGLNRALENNLNFGDCQKLIIKLKERIADTRKVMRFT